MVKFLNSERSKLLIPGPPSEYLHLPPTVPTAGSWKQLVMKFWLNVGLDNFGLQTTFTRGPRLEVPVMSAPFVVVNVTVVGAPLTKLAMPTNCQLLKIRSAGAQCDGMLGRSYTQ